MKTKYSSTDVILDKLKNRKLIVNQNIVWREVDNEAVILNIDSGDYYSLDKVGMEIWNLISEGATLGEVFNKIKNKYDVNETELSEDLEKLVKKLVKENIIIIKEK